MLIVVLVLGVMAMILVPVVQDVSLDSKVSASLGIVRVVQRKIQEHYARNEAFPPTIDAAWFASGQLRKNPFDPDHPRAITDDVDRTRDPTKYHPEDKTVAKWPFWYNAQNGFLRIRVPQQDTDAETLAIYNRANGTDCWSLDQISSPGGSNEGASNPY